MRALAFCSFSRRWRRVEQRLEQSLSIYVSSTNMPKILTMILCILPSLQQRTKIYQKMHYFVRGPPKACRIFPRRQHAADCYIKIPGSSEFRWSWLSGLSLKVVLRMSAWSCTISVKKSRLWKTPGLETLSIIPIHPWLSVASQAYLFDMVITIKKISYTYITPQSEDMLTTPSCVNRSRKTSVSNE